MFGSLGKAYMKLKAVLAILGIRYLPAIGPKPVRVSGKIPVSFGSDQ